MSTPTELSVVDEAAAAATPETPKASDEVESIREKARDRIATLFVDLYNACEDFATKLGGEVTTDAMWKFFASEREAIREWLRMRTDLDEQVKLLKMHNGRL